MMKRPPTIENLSVQELERLEKTAEALVKNSNIPEQTILRLICAAAVRGCRAELKSRETEHRDIRAGIFDFREHYHYPRRFPMPEAYNTPL